MSATQVSAGLGLLRKALPDLSAVEHSGGMTLTHEDALDELDDPGTEDQAETED